MRTASRLLRLGCAFLCLAYTRTPVVAQDAQAKETPLPAGAHYVEREFLMPVPGSLPQGLDVLEVYVTTEGKHPLVLLTHGTSDKPEERMQVTPWSQFSQALWFARRGYVTLVIVRKGYGRSGGEQDGVHGGCRGGGSFQESGEASADDLRAAVDYAAKNLPEVDVSTVISAGVSTGGFAQVALTAKPPAGLKAAINFAGGRGGDGKGDLCSKDSLLDAFKYFGKRSHTPMLWIYAENDKWFPPKYAVEFQAAFDKGGGSEKFVLAPPDGEDGHHLFGHVTAWSATVDQFLSDQQLPMINPPYPPPTPPNVGPPAGLGDRGIAAFKTFLILGPHKAFATNGTSSFGFSTGQFTRELADQHALESCEKARKGQGGKCAVVSRGSGK